MPKDRNLFQLGVMVIVVFALFITAVLFIGTSNFEPRDPIVVRIAHDQKMPRLKPGAPIICGPKQVGVVTAVSTVEAPLHTDSTVLGFLYFEFRGEVNTSLGLRSDCRIVVEGPLLGDNGQLTIEYRGTADTRATPETPIYARATGFANDLAMITREFDETDRRSLLSRIKSQLDPRRPESLMAKLHTSIDNVNEMTASLKRSVDPTQADTLVGKLDSILNHLNDVTAAIKDEMQPGRDGKLLTKVHRGLDDLDRALRDMAETIRENRPGIGNTIRTVEHIATTLDQEVVPAIADELDRANTQSLLSKARRALEKVNRTLNDVGVVADKTRKIATLGEHRILALIDNVKEASDHLKAVSKDLRRSPWRLIHKPDDTESKQAYILDAVREFAEASAHLDDSVSAMKALLEANRGGIASTDPALIAIREKLVDTLARFDSAEQALWTQLDAR